MTAIDAADWVLKNVAVPVLIGWIMGTLHTKKLRAERARIASALNPERVARREKNADEADIEASDSEARSKEAFDKGELYMSSVHSLHAERCRRRATSLRAINAGYKS